MRIPLDYYRILGLPPQATSEQIQQAHRDRALSMPRREYSEQAIASRRQVLDTAYAVLTDAAQRQAYDAKLTPEPKAIEQSLVVVVAPPTLEVDEQDVVGALLLLYELGEYNQVLNIGRVYFEPSSITSASQSANHNPDITLTVALAYLELGRESWRQGQYELAAQSLEASQELLLREGLFLNIRSEIQADLFKLRPYRVLELLAMPDYKTAERKQGLLLLQEMLEARRGIDGTGNDYSGLSIDDFLRFIQQLRSYMNVAEQQVLFEEEARRPSPVASYLAVYALIARGFSQSQPALIRRAKGLLVKLSGKQDVNLEQSVCSLLLGQTEEANNALERSGDQEQINFIRLNSADSPDLLPGLCLYSERWLQEEVYPHFRDLADQLVSLKNYFADEQVQAYLEELPNTNGSGGSEWTIANTSTRTTTRSLNVVPKPSPYADPPPVPDVKVSTYTPDKLSRIGRTSVLDRPPLENGHLEVVKTSSQRDSRVVSPLPKAKEPTKDPRRTAAKPKRKLQLGRVLLVLVLSFSLICGLIALAVWSWQSLTTPASSEAFVPLESPLIPALDKVVDDKPIEAQPGPLDRDVATKLVETWQTIKSKALGNSYEISALEGILAEPVLSDWRSRAQDLKSNNAYLQYITKPVDVKDFIAQGDDKAKIKVNVSETRNYFNNGNLDPSASKTDTSYVVDYNLVRKDNKWLIQDMIVSE